MVWWWYPSYSTQIDRLDYASDMIWANVRSNLSLARPNTAATGNASFGYWSGSYPGSTSTVDRIDYSNDTANAVTKGPLNTGRGLHAACSPVANGIGLSPVPVPAAPGAPVPTSGYFGGGISIFSSGRINIDRIDYANDTVTASWRASLSTLRYYLAATGNSSFGYFGGGGAPGALSTVDRIDYATDYQIASPKGPLSVARLGVAATGNANFGYFWWWCNSRPY